MEADRARWNARYAAGGFDFEPARWLVALEPLLSPGRALDLACGAGRNALYLAGLGYTVDAWDISEVGLAALGAELERRRATGQALDVTPRRVDLDTAELPGQHYDLILDAFFLDRTLFSRMQAALRPGGVVVVHTLMRRRQHEDRNPAHLLEPGELSSSLSGLRTLQYAEDDVAGWAELVARRDL